MAVDSILGASANTLTQTTRDVLTGILADSVGGTQAVREVQGGTVVVAEGIGHESQLGLVASSGAVQADISTGSFHASIEIPQGTVVGMQGPAENQAQDQTLIYLSNLANQAIPASNPGYRNNVMGAISNALTATGSDTMASGQLTTRVIQIGTNAPTSPGESTLPIVISGAGSASTVTGGAVDQQLVVVDTSHAPNATVVLNNISNAVVTGNSTVLLGSSHAINGGGGGSGASSANGTAVSGDMFNQVIVGGAGRDTIFGGGGFDTITGGAGPDIFGIIGGAVPSDPQAVVMTTTDRLTITDLFHDDQLFIKMAGVDSIVSLLNAVTGTSVDGNSSTVQFANGVAVTIIGMPLSEITADMIRFA